MASPSWISVSSTLAQYLPNRNSATYVGTGYWPLNWRTRSLRTRYPSNALAAIWSSASSCILALSNHDWMFEYHLAVFINDNEKGFTANCRIILHKKAGLLSVA